jgi:predicted permease
LLRPLPVLAPHQLFTVSSDFAVDRGFTAGSGWSVPMWERFRPQATRFGGAFAWHTRTITLGRGLDTQPAAAMFVSSGFFTVLGLPASRGRVFGPEEDGRGTGPQGPVAVISDRLWQRRFAGREDAVGAAMIVEGSTVTIVGITPASFTGLEVGRPIDVMLPLAAEVALRGANAQLFSPRSYQLLVMLRLGNGQPPAAATALMRQLQRDVVPADAPAFVREPFTLVAATEGTANPGGLRPVYARPLAAMLAGAGLVLGVACVNIANLQLARAAAFRREAGVRLAMGSPPARLARQVLLESVVLAAAGGLIGSVMAAGIAPAMIGWSATPIAAVEFDLDWRVVMFAAAITAVAALLSGTAPAIRTMRIDPASTLCAGGIGGRVTGGHVSNGLVVVQVALAVGLVAAAVLLVRTLTGLARVPLGFDADRVVIADVETARVAARDVAAAVLSRRLADAAGAVPGVERAAASLWTPLSGEGPVIGMRAPGSGRDAPETAVVLNFVTPGWFATYGTPIAQGRDFTAADSATSPIAVIVNQAFIRTFLPGGRAIGQALAGGQTIVGVAGDALYRPAQRIPGAASLALREPAPPTIYAALAQAAAWERPPMTRIRISARSAGPGPIVSSAAIGAALAAVDPRLEFTIRPLAGDVAAALSQERLLAGIAAAFGLVSVLLAALGVYGVAAYSVSRRRRDLGIRLAMGASGRMVLWVVLRRSLRLVLGGALLGLAGAMFLARTSRALLFGVTAADAISFAVAGAIVAVVGTIAAVIPARRAARIDPVMLLRAE